MSDEESRTEKASALEHSDPSADYAKHWTNKSDLQGQSPLEDIDVKDEWVGITLYLPEALREEMELVYQEHRLACRRSDEIDLKKLQHYYPLMVALGVELLENTDSDEIAPLISYITDEYR